VFLRLTLLLPILAASAFGGSVECSVLQELNLARTQPQAYATIVSERAPALGISARATAEAVRYLHKQRPVGVLLESAGLTQAAMAHAFDTGPRGLKGHRGSDGSRVTQRADRFGRWDQLIGENLIYGKGSARDWIVCLIVDEGIGDRYHRVNIFKREFQFVGIAAQPHSTAGQMMVTDFAAKYREGGTAVARR
jgi:uncharacterized protein YkwD